MRAQTITLTREPGRIPRGSVLLHREYFVEIASLISVSNKILYILNVLIVLEVIKGSKCYDSREVGTVRLDSPFPQLSHSVMLCVFVATHLDTFVYTFSGMSNINRETLTTCSWLRYKAILFRRPTTTNFTNYNKRCLCSHECQTRHHGCIKLCMFPL